MVVKAYCKEVIVKKMMVLLLAGVAIWASFGSCEEVKNPDTFIHATHSTVETIGVQFMLSVATREISENVYDSLLSHEPGDLETLIPSLATVVPSGDNALIALSSDGVTFITFPIRQGVQFHNGAVLTAEDVAYTFKRMLLAGATCTHQAILCDALLGTSSFSDLVDEIGYDDAFDMLDEAITVSGNNVTFRLPKPFVPSIALMADNGASMGILNKDWCVEIGCWPGTKETGEAHMNKTLEDDPMFDKMMGTGPFKFVSWEPSERVVLERFDEYWRGSARLKRVIRKIVTDMQETVLLLKNGDIDFATVDVGSLVQLEGAPGVTVLRNQPKMQIRKINFDFNVAKGSSALGSGELGEEGIPRDFFSDINVRKAFQYSFDWDALIDDALQGGGVKPYGPVLFGIPYVNTDCPQYSFDREKAIEHFKLAWDGELWGKGFRMSLIYPTGQYERESEIRILKAGVESMNPKFHIDFSVLPWAAYIGEIYAGNLPLHMFGLIPKIADPWETIDRHMHSDVYYAKLCGYNDLAEERYDALIDELASNYDPERRKELAYQLQVMNYEDSLAIFAFQGVEHVVMRDWVQGYYQRLVPSILDFYPFYKAYE